MHLVGGNAQPQIAAGNQLPGVSNYFIGNDRSQWHTGVKQYAGVSYRDVYPGVNMAFHGEQRQLEFDFIVAPGANACTNPAWMSQGRGRSRLTIQAIWCSLPPRVTLLHKPVAYQEKDGERQTVDADISCSKARTRSDSTWATTTTAASW